MSSSPGGIDYYRFLKKASFLRPSDNDMLMAKISVNVEKMLLYRNHTIVYNCRRLPDMRIESVSRFVERMETSEISFDHRSRMKPNSVPRELKLELSKFESHVLFVSELKRKGLSTSERYIVLHCDSNKKIGISTIRLIHQFLRICGQFQAVIFISSTDLTSHTRQVIDKTRDWRWESFLNKEFFVNLVDHRLVFPHRVLDQEEITELRRKYVNLDLSKIDKILKTDVVCRYYGFQVGSIVKIQFPCHGSGIGINYRLVVK